MTAKELLNYLVQLENDGQELTELEVTFDGEPVSDVDHNSIQLILT